jgi:catechol 2,3-dioxygenase-like lactoylglutathione lyase family enzyme
MAIRSAIVNATDMQRSINFYTNFLDAQILGEPTASRAVLDCLTGTIELRAVDGRTTSTWIPDDLQKGFRHIGFKVEAVDPRAEVLKAAEVPFHLDPLNAEGGVRICFFFDPDGTLLEFVQGDLQYAAVMDPDGVARERAMGVPRRPRLDHVAVTVEDRGKTEQFYRENFGFSFIGTIEQPSDPRGFSIGYLKAGDMVLEVFTYDVAKQDRAPQLDAPGFAYAQLIGGDPAGRPRAAAVDGRPIFVDTDGFTFAMADEG